MVIKHNGTEGFDINVFTFKDLTKMIESEGKEYVKSLYTTAIAIKDKKEKEQKEKEFKALIQTIEYAALTGNVHIKQSVIYKTNVDSLEKIGFTMIDKGSSQYIISWEDVHG